MNKSETIQLEIQQLINRRAKQIEMRVLLDFGLDPMEVVHHSPGPLAVQIATKEFIDLYESIVADKTKK